MEPAWLTLNLSYVLHEPSTSAIVQETAQRVLATHQALRRVADQFARLPDPSFQQGIVVVTPPPTDAPPRRRPPSPRIVSAHVGPFWLLERVLALTARQRGIALPPEPVFLDDPTGPHPVTIPFFRAPARLQLKREDLHRGVPVEFVTVALRPGGRTLHFRIDRVSQGTEDPETVEQRLIAAAERAIREHVEQWFCPGPLWDAPAEQSLPEFASS